MQLNLCQMVRQNTLYSAPARRENKDKLQNREQEGIGKRDGQVWGRKLSCCCSILRDDWLYLDVSPEIWSMPSWAFSPSFSRFPSIPLLMIPIFRHDEEERVLYVSGFQTHMPALPLYSTASFISLSCCSCWPFGVLACETPRPSRGERAYAHLCLSLFLSSWHVCPPPPSSHLRVFLCPFCRCSANIQANLQLLVSGYCWRANGHNQRWRPTAATAKGCPSPGHYILIIRKQLY